MSASLRMRLNCCAAAKCRDVPGGDIIVTTEGLLGLRSYPGAERQGRAPDRQPIEHPFDHGLAAFTGLFSRANEPVSYQLREAVDERPAGQNGPRDLAFVSWDIRDRMPESAVSD